MLSSFFGFDGLLLLARLFTQRLSVLSQTHVANSITEVDYELDQLAYELTVVGLSHGAEGCRHTQGEFEEQVVVVVSLVDRHMQLKVDV